MDQIKGKLVVSCQALENEPLHSSFIMGRMAVAAMQGGAAGIRANSVADIKEIKSQVDLPVIGIIKRRYEEADAFITSTMTEVDELMEAQPEIIAVDATFSKRVGGETLDEFYNKIREKYPNQLLMADCSTVEEMVYADKLGFDYVAPTLVGYTKQSKGLKIEDDDFAIIRETLAQITHPMIAEGNIDTPEKARRVIELGVHSVVVGSIITRPQLITKKFVDTIQNGGKHNE
ncbi:N-acylglucosamine-6-phosphate 2-epimerase [Streptococcus rupicaprae]|uniref:Putative N-acetylmannosamine-6-phosphate 2-epimerase n=1 Tax=Streptococcus rupicaprae TaxID=759619 RepID=A0ABV2FGF1_9STRE